MKRANNKGFTLIEMVIVLAVLGILAAIVIPNTLGYVGRSKNTGFDQDKRLLQTAVTAWRSDPANSAGNAYPTVGTGKGALVDSGAGGVDIGTDSTAIKISELVDDGYVDALDSVKSMGYSTGTGTGATNTPKGSYVWYVDTNGRVQGRRWTTSANDANNIVNLGELAGSDGYVTDVYP